MSGESCVADDPDTSASLDSELPNTLAKPDPEYIWMGHGGVTLCTMHGPWSPPL